MTAGEMDRRIRLERSVVTLDDHGGEAQSWQELATVWARYRAVSDSETWRAGSIEAASMGRFQIRHSAQVAPLGPKDRLIFEGETYYIRGIKEIERNRTMEITAEARVDDEIQD